MKYKTVVDFVHRVTLVKTIEADNPDDAIYEVEKIALRELGEKYEYEDSEVKEHKR